MRLSVLTSGIYLGLLLSVHGTENASAEEPPQIESFEFEEMSPEELERFQELEAKLEQQEKENEELKEDLEEAREELKEKEGLLRMRSTEKLEHPVPVSDLKFTPEECRDRHVLCDEDGVIERKFPGEGKHVGLGFTANFPLGFGIRADLEPHPGSTFFVGYSTNALIRSVQAGVRWNILPSFEKLKNRPIDLRWTPVIELGYAFMQVHEPPDWLSDWAKKEFRLGSIGKKAAGLKGHAITATGGFEVYFYHGSRLRFFGGILKQISVASVNDDIHKPTVENALLPYFGADFTIMIGQLGDWAKAYADDRRWKRANRRENREGRQANKSARRAKKKAKREARKQRRSGDEEQE